MSMVAALLNVQSVRKRLFMFRFKRFVFTGASERVNVSRVL